MNLIKSVKSRYLLFGPTNTQGMDIMFEQSFAITAAAIRITLAYGHISLASSDIGCLKRSNIQYIELSI